MISGMKTSDQLKEEYKKEDEKSQDDLSVHKISEKAESFEGISEVCKDNEDLFKFIAGTIIINYLINFDKL
jgi:hypothetical protein